MLEIKSVIRTLMIALSCCHLSIAAASVEPREGVLRFASGIDGLNLAMRFQRSSHPSHAEPVLILHGATFPSGNAAAWKIGGRSWMDEIADAGYDVYALDFLGYGAS